MPDTSFPFLKIARDHCVPYADVVRISETTIKPACEFSESEAASLNRHRTPALMVDITCAVMKERGRRYIIREGDCRHD